MQPPALVRSRTHSNDCQGVMDPQDLEALGIAVLLELVVNHWQKA
jgi:hypothetical protein